MPSYTISKHQAAWHTMRHQVSMQGARQFPAIVTDTPAVKWPYNERICGAFTSNRAALVLLVFLNKKTDTMLYRS